MSFVSKSIIRATIASKPGILLLLTGLLLGNGCAVNDQARIDARDEHIRALRETAEQAGSIPAPADSPRTPKPPQPSAEASALITESDRLPDIPVRNLDLGRETDVAVVLRALARGADINLILGRGVSGPVLLNLPAETSWSRLFTMIVDTHGLHYEYRDGLLRVLSQDDIERQSALERALRERELAREDRQRAEPLQLELYRVRYADVESLANSIRSGLTNGTGEQASTFSVIPDRDSGLLILRAPSNQMREALALTRQLDQPAFQILIEATIVQANSETARELGMQWGALHNAADGGRVTIGTSANPAGFNSNFPARFDGADGGFTFGIERLSRHQLLQAQLSALQREGRLSIVSSPSITTLDKQTAVIESGEERPFQSAAGTGVTATPTVEFKKALLTLEVTPQVIDGNWIKLLIRTTKDDFDDSRAVLIDGTLQVPISTRMATTTLYLADGQTTVIGGLATDTASNQVEGIPFLKNLPLLGPLFRNTNQRNVLTDTVIFITPRILPERITQPPANDARSEDTRP